MRRREFLRTRQICHKTLLSLALLGVLAGCGQSSGPGSSGGGEGSLTLLTIGTADSGGTMYQAGSAIVQAITQEDRSIKINISASTGSNMNVNSLASGEVDLALVSGDVAYAAEAGDSGLKAPEGGLRAIAAVYSSVSSWTVLADSSYVYVHELAGATVGVGPEGSSTDLSAQVAISALALRERGTSLINCGLGDGARLLANGDLDAVHGFTGMPIPSITDLSEKEPCRLLLYTPEELSAILAENPVYYAAQIPAEIYPGQTEAVDTFGVKCLLCVSGAMPEELAYQLAQALWDASGHMGEYHPCLEDMAQAEFLCQDLPIPLHPGAERFYEEMGVLP